MIGSSEKCCELYPVFLINTVYSCNNSVMWLVLLESVDLLTEVMSAALTMSRRCMLLLETFCPGLSSIPKHLQKRRRKHLTFSFVINDHSTSPTYKGHYVRIMSGMGSEKKQFTVIMI